MCKYKPTRAKIKTSYIVVLSDSSNGRFLDYECRRCRHDTFILVQPQAIACQ